MKKLFYKDSAYIYYGNYRQIRMESAMIRSVI